MILPSNRRLCINISNKHNRLLAAPGGPSTFLSTFNYTLWLLAFLEAKSLPLQAKLFQRLGKAAYPTTASPGPSSIASLATLLSSCRVTLRLLGLLGRDDDLDLLLVERVVEGVELRGVEV